jgi:ABC-type transport system involved in multi-copper enzyme maturation permease subunit
VTSFLALFRDAWRRARDRKTVTILVVVGLIVALLCASFEFGRPVPTESLKRHLSECAVDPRPSIGHGKSSIASWVRSALKQQPRITAREPTAEDDLPLGLANVAVAELEVADLDDLDRLVRKSWDSQGETPAAEPRKADAAAQLSNQDRGEFLESMLRGHGWETVLVRPQGDDPSRFLVAAATDHLTDLEGRWRLGALFGSVPIPINDMSPSQMVVTIEQVIAGVVVGFIGMLVLLAAFGGAMPDLLQKGSLDLVLARPIGRTRLLLYTYAGAVLTVLLVTATIFLACALTLGVRSGHLSLAFVGCALAATAIFAALFPVAMLFGYLTRNGNIATIAAVACWGLAGLLNGSRIFITTRYEHPPDWTKAIDWAYWIAPKTSDIANLGAVWLARTEYSPQAFERFKAQFPLVPDAASACSSTAIFAAVILLITALLFRRRDC